MKVNIPYKELVELVYAFQTTTFVHVFDSFVTQMCFYGKKPSTVCPYSQD